MLKIQIVDVSGTRRNQVEAPDDVAIDRILAVIVDRLQLPLNSPDGQIMSYKLHHKRTGKQLLDEQTLSDSEVINGDELRIQPEITAGSGPAIKIQRDEDRFSRFDSITWWNQETLRNAKVLVAGAGALGNEVIKNLALLGVGNILIADFDHIEKSNLSRSVLFRESNNGQSKARCAAQAAKEIYPDINVMALDGNILADLGYGWFQWADIIVGALDNREARIFLNKASYYTRKPWLDGGIDIFTGVVRGFNPPKSACYECTMSRVDWELVEKRRSCSLIARKAFASRGTPTTPTQASIIGAMQVQEVLKYLHNMEFLEGKGFFFEGLHHNSYQTEFSVKPDCPWHESSPKIIEADTLNRNSTWQEIWDWVVKYVGNIDALDFEREIVSKASYPKTGLTKEIFESAETVAPELFIDTVSGSELYPEFITSITSASLPEYSDRSLADIGLPAREMIWARKGVDITAIVLSGDSFVPLEE